MSENYEIGQMFPKGRDYFLKSENYDIIQMFLKGRNYFPQ